ncbi:MULTISPECIES: hypothetical protein [Enterobacteriaceae]|jgi:hypothetical protein|uniref:hypothetical protein n=1 Tax=Enterobacteriaceae TaxID=543 RepID=UPI0005F1725E|nr:MULTISPECIES: hypothetical protein [Enterobacteriaceae]EDH6013319.1 hypothetical protein [Salmonella enterica subsp. enterica serovar Kinshasa]EEE0519998.1 hypothetical protein [Salmonella enterica subsp. enterica serovar Uganda]EEG1746426.1 hypothetical protein [Salmonella enterica subsp. enterica]EGM6075049.1 hypothetical protein [Salmonella enterica]DAO75512.1 MAG TPA: Protein of unknown function (DUF2594) [Caudoviricetes sp.]HAV1627914.1 hypothetical protein [Enterobacter hormaechei su
MSNIRYIEGLKLSTTCDTLEDVATEVTALKLALGLLFARLPDAEKNNLLIELTQYDYPAFQKISTELKQFMPK